MGVAADPVGCLLLNACVPSYGVLAWLLFMVKQIMCKDVHLPTAV